VANALFDYGKLIELDSIFGKNFAILAKMQEQNEEYREIWCDFLREKIQLPILNIVDFLKTGQPIH